VEVPQRRKDGSRFEAAVWTAPTRDSNRQVTGVVAAVADISERKTLEERIRFSAKMEAVGRLAGGIAHDFNNLLTVINGYSSMLLDSMRFRQEDYASSQAQEILNAGTRAADLVAKLLAFSRRQVTERRMFDVNEMVRSVERMLGRLIGEHIELKIDLAPEAGWVMADPGQMEAALINLATNARDAMARGGVLSIETTRAEMGPEARGAQPAIPAGSYTAIAVRDTGDGMDAETRQHIFEPFFTTKERGRGTGLGLSSVYGAVEQNGGFVFVTSEVGHGATFSLYFPRFESPAVSQTKDVVSGGTSSGTETILLVEDEAPLRRMLREALCNAGYRVWESGDGAQAMVHWGSKMEEIDLVVTDVVMPVMGGLRLAAELRRRREDIKVVFMSGHADELLVAQGAVNAAMNFLQKPFLPLDLVLLVRRTLDRATDRDSCNSKDT
jgi:signal transduction histidine kinase/ActR/RegA family two-component response regulator